MSIQITRRTDYSALFSSLNGGKSTGIGGGSYSLADYASIKNGSYGKLMKAYYGKGNKISKNKTALSDAASATKKTNSKTATADTTSENASLQKSANALVKSAESLLKTGKDSVFKEKDIATKDENGVEKTTKGYDTDAIYKAVSAFADDYNSVLNAAAKSKNNSVVSTASNMVQQTVANEKMLSRIGITIGEDNKLSVDEKKLKAADMTTVKSMMNGNGSFAYGVQTKASFISMYAKNDQNKASGVYGSSATYTASLFSNGDIWNSFI